MIVKIESASGGDEPDSLAVYLDSGKEIGRYSIVDDPKLEKREFEQMLYAVSQEAQEQLRERLQNGINALPESKRASLYALCRENVSPFCFCFGHWRKSRAGTEI